MALRSTNKNRSYVLETFEYELHVLGLVSIAQRLLIAPQMQVSPRRCCGTER